MDSPKIPDGIKTVLNLIEKEAAPSLFCMAFLMSVGGFYAGGFVISLIIIITIVILFFAYKTQHVNCLAFGRVALFLFTCVLYLILLTDDHIFEDSTLPQVIEMHMTDDARVRHGASRDYVDLNPLFGNLFNTTNQ